MARTTPSRRLIVVSVLLALVAATACQPQPRPSPAPTPDPGPRYQPIESDWCERIGFPEIYTRFGLTELFDPTLNYTAHGDYWHAACSVDAEAVDDDFATHHQPRFRTNGMIVFYLYSDPAEAEEHHRHLDLSPGDYAQSAMVSPVHGWWQRGAFSRYIRDLGMYDEPGADRIQALFIHYAVYDHNLVVQMDLSAQAYQGEIPRLARFLHRLADAILDEVATDLVLIR